ncbi:MAG: hypothetical protein CL398_10935 [Acidiferrobacteraceae bacterium]|nr:hypothetical protein [Acidiferrobacteraceae bacterium]|tara:strand:+ start:1128 stop:1445 length:318 start_codon:yes stop_codon:yes gene_type:complete
MHLLHPDQLPTEVWEGFPFKALLNPDIGGGLGVYLLTIKNSNPHAHDDLDQIYIIIDGYGQMNIDGQTRKIRPGSLVHIPKGKMHSLTPAGNGVVTVYSIEYHPR